MLERLKRAFGLKIRKKDIRMDKQGILFAIAAVLFLVEINGPVLFSFVSTPLAYLMAAMSAVFIAYVVAYASYVSGNEHGTKKALECLFSAFVLLFLISSAVVFGYYRADLYAAYYIFLLVISVIPFFLPLILFVFLGRSMAEQRVAKKYRRKYRVFAAALFAAAVILIVMFFLSKYFVTGASVDDEEFIGLQAAVAFANGQNPYAVNVAAPLYKAFLSNFSGLPTLTTTGTLVGTLNYPALFFLVSVPFAIISKAGLYNFQYTGMFVDIVLFSVIMVFAVTYSIKREHLKLPPVILILFLLLSISFVSSFVNFLMFGLLTFAFYKSGSKYVWILLGICASLQEQLWIPVLLLIIYSFSNHGSKRGAANLIGTALVFLLINGYFIALGPSIYLKDVFTPVNGYLFPSPQAPFGYLLMKVYPILLSSYTPIFFGAIAASAIAFIYLNQKRLVFLFSLVPLMFLYHAIPPYYDFFIGMLVISFYIKDDIGALGPHPAKERRVLTLPLAVTLVMMIAIGLAAYAIHEHGSFQRTDVYVSNATAAVSGNYLIYDATLHYGNGSPQSLFAMEYSAYGSLDVPGESGPLGPQILHISGENLTQPRNVSSNLTNINIILLGQPEKSVNFSIAVPGNPANAISAQCVLYYGNYYYICPDAFVRK